MAVLHIYNPELPFDTLDVVKLLDADIIVASATQIQAVLQPSPPWTINLFGSFTYDTEGFLIGGVLTGISQVYNGTPSFEISNISIAVSAFAYMLELATLGSPESLLYSVFAGPDELFGSEQDDVLRGYYSEDIVRGAAGNDKLYSSDQFDGIDTLIGGSGNDVYFVDRFDSIIEAADDGIDTVSLTARHEPASYFLPANIENLTFDGPNGFGAGNGLGNAITAVGSGNTLFGLEGNDVLTAFGDNNRLDGGDGNDAVGINGSGNILDSGTGNDFGGITGANNTLRTGAGDDGLVVIGNNNSLDGGDGNDQFDAFGSGNTFLGGSGNDGLGINGSNGIMAGGDGDDYLGVTGSGNRINGDAGNDGLVVVGNNNTLDGGVGDDVLVLLGTSSGNVLTGGTGADRFALARLGVNTIADFSIAEGDALDLTGAGVVDFAQLTLTQLGANALIAFGGATHITLDNVLASDLTAAQFLFGGSGIIGGGGPLVSGTAGNDTLVAPSEDATLVGGAGDDTYHVAGAGIQITENANEGTDTVIAGVSVALPANVENLRLDGAGAMTGTGNALDNAITATGGAKVLVGLGGNDILTAFGDNNTLDGGDGNDAVGINGAGNTLDGGTGNDFGGITGSNNLLRTGGGDDGLVVVGNANTLDGGDGNDLFDAFGSGNTFLGGAGNDGLGINGSNGTMAGGDGDDFLGVTGSNNRINGDAGNDGLVAVGGNNTLAGGTGDDVLVGGSGSDRFVFTLGDGLDTIANFAPGQGDVIALAGYGIADFAALQPNLAQSGGDVLIAFDAANVIALNNLTLAELGAGQFFFS